MGVASWSCVGASRPMYRHFRPALVVLFRQQTTMSCRGLAAVVVEIAGRRRLLRQLGARGGILCLHLALVWWEDAGG